MKTPFTILTGQNKKIYKENDSTKLELPFSKNNRLESCHGNTTFKKYHQ